MHLSFVLAVCFNPRRLIRRITENNRRAPVLLVACLAGMALSLNTQAASCAGDRLPLWTILTIAMLWGPLSGIAWLWVWSVAVRWSGKWLGGRSTLSQLRLGLGLAAVPYAASLVIWIAALFLAGNDLFTSDSRRLSDRAALSMVPGVTVGLLVVLALWSAVIGCHAISVVQGYCSAWRGLWNLLLAGMVTVALPLALFVVLS